MKNSLLAALLLLSSAFTAIAQAPTVGPYPNTSITAGSNSTVSPAGAPTNTTRMVAFTNTNFTGVFSVDPVTGIVRITDAKQAGVYPVTVKAFGPGGTATRSFTLTITSPSCSQGLFVNGTAVGIGGVSMALAIGDFNNDGHQDIATTSNTIGISIFMGNGLGGFTSGAIVSVGSFPESIVLGDINGDGFQDFLTANFGDNTVSVRLGDGLGGFSGTTDIPVGSLPNHLALGDFNGDGHQDFATANTSSHTISIRLGNGLGGFSGTNEETAGNKPVFVAIGDFNEDGKQDFIAANELSDNVSVRLGDGLGDFIGTTDIAVGADPHKIAIADFNGDGHQDFATANNSSGDVSIRLGDGLGGFSGTTNIAVGLSPYSIAVGDFNGDGDQDFACVNFGSNSVSIRVGDGVGGFSGTTNPAIPASPRAVAVGDFNEDGIHDFAVTSTSSNILSIRLGGANEMNVRGNSITIVDGDVLATTADHSDFGSVLVCSGTIVRTFRIENTGAVNLTLGSITITGANAGDFTVTALPVSPVTPGNNTTFQVTFDASATGIRNATINIANDDCDENPYNFAVRGTGNADVVAPLIYNIANSGSSDAAATAYNDGWQSGDNDGNGFGAWTLASSTGNTSQAGFVMGSSTLNGAGNDVNSDGDINTGGRALGLYANSAQATQATRALTAPLVIGNTLRLEFDNGTVDPGQIVGFQLQNSSGLSLGEVRFRGGQAGYELVDANGITPFASVPFTDEAIIIEVTPIAAGQSSIKLIRKVNGATQTITSLLFPGGGNQVISRFMIFNSNAGVGVAKYLYVNNFNVTSPTLGCPANINVSNNTGVCQATVVYPSIVAIDNCSGSVIVTQTSGLPSASAFPVGTTVNTFSATDGSGNTATCSFSVIVSDTTDPIAACRNATVYLGNVSGTVNISPSVVDNGSSDNCGPVMITLSQTSFSCANIGANNVTLTVNDMNGNSSTCTGVVTVLDSARPVVNTQNITVHLNPAGSATIIPAMINNGSTDNCGIASMAVIPNTFSCANVGTNNVTLTVIDVNGNNRTGTAVVTVIDTVRPVAICQSGTIQIPLDGTGNATILFSLIDNGSSDACGVSLMSVSPNTFNCASQGFPTLTLTVTDANGNTSTCTSTAIVFDGVAPIANCQNINVYLDGSGNTNITPAMVNNGSTDECQMATMSVTPNSFNCSNTGPNNVTLTVFDTMGATDQCTSIVTVLDSTRPVVNCQNITLQLNAAGTASITPAMINNGSTDNCGIASMTVSQNSFSCANIGPNNVTLTVTDNSGNSSTCVAVVTVADTVDPVASCANFTAYLNASGTITPGPSAINSGSFDVCGIISYNVSPSTFTCANVGPNNVTLTVNDVNGNSSSCTSVITVMDTVRPVANTQNISVYLNAAGNTTVSAAMINNGSSDACGIASMIISQNTFTCANVGANSVLFTVFDVTGNSRIRTAVVTVIDTVRPVAVAQNITVTLSGGVATITAAAINNGSSDACGIASMSVTPNSFTCTNLGANTVTLTITDVNGNTSTATAIATVLSDLTSSVSANNHVSCFGGSNGQATVATSGGAGIFTYSWSPSGGTAATASGLSAGTYTVTATDGGGCTTSSTVNITEPLSAIAASSVSGNILCNGGSTTVTVTGNGGTSPYTGIGTFTVTAGTYSYTVTDVNGCAATTSITIAEPTPLVPTASGLSVLCNGGTTSVTVAATGGTAPYTGTGTFTEIAGTFFYTVTDANGCSAVTSVNISEPVVLGANSSTFTPVLCNGGSAIVTVAGTGGTAPYTGTGAFTVTAGTYSYTVTDANGCTATTSITVTEPTALSAGSSATSVMCSGGTATVTVTGNGGTSPYTGAGTFTVSAGTYSYTVTDANGCTATTSVTITEPTAISSSVTTVNVSCNGGADGSIDLTVSGGTSPYTFDWNSGTYTTEDISGLVAGTYSGVLTDANGCTNSGTIIITEPAVLLAVVTSATNPTTCSGTDGAIDITVTGGTTAYSFLWNTSATSEDLSGIGAGSYSCVVTDANGCTANAGATLNDPNAPTVLLSLPLDTLCFDDGAITLTGESPIGGTFSGPGVSAGLFTPGIAGMGTHAIAYTYTDVNGCTGSTIDSVYVDACLGIATTETSVFEVYPNPNNGTFTLQFNATIAATANIYDVQGKLVSTHYLQPATTQQMNIAEPGIYVIVILTNDNQMSSQRIIVTQ